MKEWASALEFYSVPGKKRPYRLLPGPFISLSSYRLRQQLHAQINAEPSGV